MAPLEAKIVAKGNLPAMVRPWTTPVPELKDTVKKELTFGADDEDIGLVQVGWQGPSGMDFDEVRPATPAT